MKEIMSVILKDKLLTSSILFAIAGILLAIFCTEEDRGMLNLICFCLLLCGIAWIIRALH